MKLPDLISCMGKDIGCTNLIQALVGPCQCGVGIKKTVEKSSYVKQ
jgi:hypothetical protein